MKRTVVAGGTLALFFAGVASAAALGTIFLKPGHCTTVHGRRVCAVKASPRTVTVYPSPVGQNFSGNGEETLAPFTLAKGAELHWTLNDTCGAGMFINDNTHSNSLVDSDAPNGETYLDAGSYELEVIACGDWTISF